MKEFDWEKIYKDNYRTVYWTCLSFLKNPADAEDITQNVFISAIENLKTSESEKQVAVWLKTVAVRKCLDVIKLRRTVSLDERLEDDESGEAQEPVDENFLPDEYAIDKEKRQIVMNILHDVLNEEQYLTVVMFYFDEMSIQDIAKAMGVPEGTIKSRLNTSRRRIKEGVEMYEKKNNDKLYAAAPFLSLLLKNQALTDIPTVPPIPQAISARIPSPKITNIKEAAKHDTGKDHSALSGQTAKAAAKGGIKMSTNKIIITAACALAATAGVVTTVVLLNKDKEPAVQPETTVTDSSAAEEAGGKTSGDAAQVTGSAYLLANDDNVSFYEKIHAVVKKSICNDPNEYNTLTQNSDFRYEYDASDILIEYQRSFPELIYADPDKIWASDEEMLNDEKYQRYVSIYESCYIVSAVEDDDTVTIYFYSALGYSEDAADTFLQTRLLQANGGRLAEDCYRNAEEFMNDQTPEKLKELVYDYAYTTSIDCYHSSDIYYKVTYDLVDGFISDEDMDDLTRKLLFPNNGCEEVTFDEAWQYNTTTQFLPFTGDVNPYYQKEG